MVCKNTFELDFIIIFTCVEGPLRLKGLPYFYNFSWSQGESILEIYLSLISLIESG